VRYAQQLENTGFFIHVTAVLYLFGSCGRRYGAFSGSEEPVCDPLPDQRHRKRQDRRIILVKRGRNWRMEPSSFISLESLATMSSATVGTTAAANTFRSIFKRDPRICAVIVSLLISFCVTWQGLKEPAHYIVAFLNACLLYCAASGLTSTISDVAGPPPGPPPAERKTMGSPRSARWQPVQTFFAKW
jgi:hypothetical protein